MASHYSKRVKSRQIQDAKQTRATSRAYRRYNNRKSYRKSFGDFCSPDFYCPSTNNFGTAQSRRTATFLRLCKRGDEVSTDFVSARKISKATIIRGLEIAMTFGHMELVDHFIELGVANYFPFQPVQIHPCLEFSRIVSLAIQQNNLRFCKWFVSQAISQGKFIDEFMNELYPHMNVDDLSLLRMLLKCHPDPAFIIESEHLLSHNCNYSRLFVVELLLEFEPKVTEEIVDHAIELGWVSVLETVLKTGRLKPKHSEHQLPRLLNLAVDEDYVVLSPKEMNVVRTLVKYGANLNEREEGMSLLHAAAIQLTNDDRYAREVIDFMVEFMSEFDYTETYEMTWLAVDLLPVQYRSEYEMKMAERIDVVRDIVCEVGQVPWDCAGIVAVCLYGEAVRILSLLSKNETLLR